MSKKPAVLLLSLLFVACTKENTGSQLRAFSESFDKVYTPPDPKIPLDDLGVQTFGDSVGGLYPGGTNSPAGTYAHDLFLISQRIVPLDTFGNVSSSSAAKIVFISMGGSTGGHNMKNLQLKTYGNTLCNQKVKIINGNTGTGEGALQNIMDPGNTYWDHITQMLRGTRSSYRQVQVLYLESDDTTRFISWPQRPTLVKNDVEICMQVMKKKFPNLKVLYVLGRTRTFGDNVPWNKEPSPYYFGWGCKWAIQDQIKGVAGTQYKGRNPVAPMITWGFYQWADSLPRRTDQFYWRSSETEDGLHANSFGEDTLTDRFQNFLLTDRNAKIWYAAH
jgi:hypothetical protein